MHGISVIICTQNGRDRLEPVLLALQNQTGLASLPVEILLIDNGSSDDTAAFARQIWTHPGIPLHVIHEANPGITAAREIGFRRSRYEILCWVDDDNVLAPDYLAEGASLLARDPLAAVCGGRGILVTSQPLPPWVAKDSGAYATGPQGTQDGPVSLDRRHVYGAGAFFRRAALEELYAAGFRSLLAGGIGDRQRGGEDLEICYALYFLGWHVIQSQRLVFEHRISSNRLEWDYSRALCHSYGEVSAINNLYFSFFGHNLKQRFKRTWPGVCLTVLYNQLAAAFYRLLPPASRTSSALHVEDIRGRAAALRHLHRTGLLQQYFFQIRSLHDRTGPLRERRTTSP